MLYNTREVEGMTRDSEQTDNHEDIIDPIPVDCWGMDIQINSAVVRENILDIQKNIAPYKTRIIGVTKYYGRDSVISGYKAGLRDFGESRALEAIEKINSLPREITDNATFHFIGHLQTNKVSKVVKYFDYIHSVDSLKLASAIAKEARALNKTEKILLEINISNEEQKFGYTKEDVTEDLPRIFGQENLDVIGLMTMLPLNTQKEEQLRMFDELRVFRDKLEMDFQIRLPELSMGMSDDYISAVESGATMIRIGRKLFNSNKK